MTRKKVKLGDYINILSGYPFESNYFSDTEGFPVIRIRDVIRGYTNTRYAGKYNDAYIIKEGDILVGMDGEFNTAKWGSKPALLNQRVCKIFSKDSQELSNNYLHYLLPKKLKEIEDRTPFVTVKHLSVKGVNNIEVLLPPIHIQEQIADTLDKADALCRKDQELLSKYDQLAQAIFCDMFGDPGVNDRAWETTKLSQVFHKVKDGTKCGPFGSALKREEYVSEGIPVWTMDNIKNGKFTSQDCLFITKEKYSVLKPYSVDAGDIIISRAGTVGKMCVVESHEPDSVISTNLIRLSLDESLIDPYFFVSLMKYFGSSVGRLKKGADGSFTHMNTGILNNLEFGLPPILLQNRFVDRLKNIEAQKKIIRANKSGDFTSLVTNLMFE